MELFRRIDPRQTGMISHKWTESERKMFRRFIPALFSKQKFLKVMVDFCAQLFIMQSSDAL
jgi:hypothetical protein